LYEEVEKSGWDVKVLDPLALTIVVDQDGGKIFNRGWPVECEAVIPRIGYSITRRGVAIVRQFEREGTIVLNKSIGITQSRDKLLACQLMSDNEIPVPITAHVGSWKDTARAVSRVGGTPCVIKSTEGTHGYGVFLAKSDQQARQLVYQMLERNMRPLVQDIRVLVVGGEVVASMKRKANGSEFRSNFHLGGSVQKIEINEEQKRIACLAASAMGLDLAGVDMLLSSRGPLILEVNSSPGLEGIETSTGVNIAAEVARYLNLKYQEKITKKEVNNIKEVNERNQETGVY
jgi:ribosomal protein S6--L-glutamate ligase